MHDYMNEFKPRKAKFGFKIERVGVAHICPLAKLIEHLKPLPKESYFIEFAQPFRSGAQFFKLYTDDAAIADIVRTTFIPLLNEAVDAEAFS